MNRILARMTFYPVEYVVREGGDAAFSAFWRAISEDSPKGDAALFKLLAESDEFKGYYKRGTVIDVARVQDPVITNMRVATIHVENVDQLRRLEGAIGFSFRLPRPYVFTRVWGAEGGELQVIVRWAIPPNGIVVFNEDNANAGYFPGRLNCAGVKRKWAELHGEVPPPTKEKLIWEDLPLLKGTGQVSNQHPTIPPPPVNLDRVASLLASLPLDQQEAVISLANAQRTR